MTEKRPEGPNPHIESAAAPTAEQLIKTHLEPDPYRPGIDNARLKESGYHVPFVISTFKAVDNSVQDRIGAVAAELEISRESVNAVMSYYDRHTEVINARLLVDAAASEIDPLFTSTQETVLNWSEINDAYERMNQDPELRQENQEEQKAWEATLLDGQEEPYQ